MIIFRLFALLVLSSSAFSAGGELPHFEEDVRILHYVHSDGRGFEAQRFDPQNPKHYKAAQQLDLASNSDPVSSASSLLNMCPQFYQELGQMRQADFSAKLNAAIPPNYPLAQYLLFAAYPEGKALCGTFGLAIPDAFSIDMNLESATVAFTALSVADGQNEAKEVAEGEEIKNNFPRYAEVTRFILKEHRGSRLGFVMSSMIHRLVGDIRGKSILVPRFNPESQTFSNEWTSASLLGVWSSISLHNIASLSSHLVFPDDLEAPEDVQVIEGPSVVQVVYPKGDDASEQSMRNMKMRIKDAKKEYKRSQR